MACFMAHESHRLVFRFNSLWQVGLDALEAGIGEVEGNADQGRSVGASPLVAEIDRRLEGESLRIELPIELFDHSLHARTGDRESQLGYLLRHEVLALAFPVGECFVHDRSIGGGQGASQMADARCPMPDARCPIPDTRYPIPVCDPTMPETLLYRKGAASGTIGSTGNAKKTGRLGGPFRNKFPKWMLTKDLSARRPSPWRQQ